MLPIVKDAYDKLSVSTHIVFASDDKSWKHVFPALAVELEAYNAKTREVARAAGTIPSTEKFIGYKYDSALGQLLSKVLPKNTGLLGFVLAALLGAIVSSLAAMLNAASTIFTMDVFTKYINPKASQGTIVLLGRICVIAFSVIAISLSPALGNPKFSHSIFTIIQDSQGFISPGIVSVFIVGLLIHKAPRSCGVIGLLTSIISYGVLKFSAPQVQFLNRMAICFALCLAVMGIITVLKPLAQPVEFKVNTKIELHSSKGSIVAGVIVVILTLVLYAIFSPIGIAK